MSAAGDDDTEKSHEPTPEKLRNAREKGEVARAPDLLVAAGYLGLILAAMTLGAQSVTRLGSGLMHVLERPDALAHDDLFPIGQL